MCKNFKFPIDHPFVPVGDTCKNVEACVKMDDLIRCTVVPPKSLYHPVLPYRFITEDSILPVQFVRLRTERERRMPQSQTPKGLSKGRGSLTK